MSVLYVFAASGMEAQPVRRICTVSNSNSGLSCGTNNVALITGAMGPKNARSKAEAALNGRPGGQLHSRSDAVISIGLCGGLDSSLPHQRIVAYTECMSTDGGRTLPCSPAITDWAISVLAAANVRCDRVVGITSTRIATTPARKAALGDRGATVVDMESYSILEVAARAGIPAAVIRVVSDPHDWELPDFNRALSEDGGLDGWKALRVALGSPLRTLKLLGANKRAMQSLGPALEIVLKADTFAVATS